MRYVSDTIQRWYEKTPMWTRSFASSVYGLLKSHRESTSLFSGALRTARARQWLTYEQLADLQADHLRSMIRYVFQKVPYYERLFVDHGIRPGSIQTVDDLRQVPTLSKDIVRMRWQDLISREVSVASLRRESTSGTTGAPLTVWMDDETYVHTKALQWLQHEWGGYSHREWAGILAGYKVIPMQRTSPPFWVTNIVGKQIHFSSYHLRGDLLPYYVEKLKRSRVQFLLGYPSAVGVLARHIVDQKDFLPLRAVFLSSEPLYEWQHEAIHGAFGCAIYNCYGQAERVLSGLSCGSAMDLHVEVDLSVVEFVPLPGGGGDMSMLVVSSLVNRAMPLLRYELHDITRPVSGQCSCGRALPRVRPIETKREDVVVTSTGRILPPSLFTFPLKNAIGVVQSQIVQEDAAHIEVRVVADEKFSRHESSRLRNEFRSLVGEELDVAITAVSDIPRTNSGKFRFVVSNVAHVGMESQR